MDVEPQIYLLYAWLCILKLIMHRRWIRCLFGHEFSLEETLILWDSIFAYDKTLLLVDYLAISMLTEIRSERTQQLVTSLIL